MSNRKGLLRAILLGIVGLACCVQADAQRFFNLTADEVRIDSCLPRFSFSQPLTDHFNDSLYTVSIVYPEFIDMTAADISSYLAITTDSLPEMPEVECRVVTDRKKGVLETTFVPLVFREGKYQMLVSFMLKVEAVAKNSPRRARVAEETGPWYADSSVLASGKWAKIRVTSTGVYEITEALVKKAGFSLNKVRIYGYGGALLSEKVNQSDLRASDDLKEVPTCLVNGHLLFHAQGPVSWSQPEAMRRTRNPYSNYGYYFLTEGEGERLSVDSAAFVGAFYPGNADYHTLYEVDGFAWYHSGRNLYDSTPISQGTPAEFVLNRPGPSETGQLAISVTAGVASKVTVSLNGNKLGQLTIQLGKYDEGGQATGTYTVENLHATDTVKVTVDNGGPVRLDFIDLYTPVPRPAPKLNSATYSVPEYLYLITNQNLHADRNIDLVIIIPASQKTRAQAERLADYHTTMEGMRVKIVPADELFNEFSSGTPDASAYRNYMKMLYDKAESEDDMPKNLLLFGDGLWDNRMLTSDARGFSPDDFLLCFESENSFSTTYSYVDDGYFGYLDEGEGVSPETSDKMDIGIGRISCRDLDEAKTAVDKTLSYAWNKEAGAWQNVVMFLGDDGNGNDHMSAANSAADQVLKLYPDFLVKKVMWDAYQRESSSTGNTYPDATKTIKQQQATGCLVIDYCGHGSEISISHERVLMLPDFQNFSNTRYPLWVTASCDIMPFDASSENIGEAAIFNKKGGAVAFFGTTRTVFTNYNLPFNKAFIKHVLSSDGGVPITLGEAQRRAKNEMITSGQDRSANKLQYSLLGDPALHLWLPTMKVVVDSINGQSAKAASTVMLPAGSTVKVVGHVESEGSQVTDYDGIVTATVRDTEELVVCRLNDPLEADKPFQYYDRPDVLVTITDSVRGGAFSFSFAVPLDVKYDDGTGLINLYAVDNTFRRVANGSCDNFVIGAAGELGNDSIGPSIYCYLNTPSFTNGDKVNSTPYFVAVINDKNGINASGAGIGHDLELIIDNEMTRTYLLNENFTYDFGTFTSGSTYYNIPELEEGPHKLKFRAWDVMNNLSTAELSFTVVHGLSPQLFSVACTENPARESTTFIVNHDRTGSDMDVVLDIFDISGRHLWQHAEQGVSTGNAYTIRWDLTIDGGERLQTGVYLYRVSISCNGSPQVSKAKKLIVIGNN